MIHHPHVEKRDAVFFVKGTNIPVVRLWGWHKTGTRFEVLFRRYPQVPKQRILDALAFVYDNPDVVLGDTGNKTSGGTHA